MVGVVQKLPDARPVKRRGVPVGVLGGKVGGPVEIGLCQPKLGQRERRVQAAGESVKRRARIRCFEYLCNGGKQVWNGGGVERDGMGQNDGVGFSMGKTERPAESVAKLVVQRHAHLSQHRAAKPRAV